MTRHRAVAATSFAFALLAAPASAGDPVMPLDQVRSGMQCTSYSVIRGTEPSEFAVEILDVIDGDPSLDGPRILIGVSGPAVDRTGVGPGFSGSPIYCPDGAGVRRVVGAISESVGEYGGTVGLATPIEAILSVSPDPPGQPLARLSTVGTPGASAARPRFSTRLGATVLPLTAPLTVTGLTRPLGRVVAAAGRRAGRIVLSAPAGPAGSYPVQVIRPGSALAVGLSSGDLTVSAVGTAAYVDGTSVWGYGHGLDDAGARSLLMQDAYVFRVINNPNTGGELGSTYKLAVGGHPIGTFTHDATDGVAGKLGVAPETVPVHVYATDADTGRTRESHSIVADESRFGNPMGASPIALVAPLAVTQSSAAVLGSAPSQLSGRMCAQIVLAEVRRPVRICNRYVAMGASPSEFGLSNVVADRAGADVADALAEIDAFQLGTIRVREVSARITLRRGPRQAYLRAVRAPRRVRPGQRIRVSVVIRRVRGATARRTFAVRVPRGLHRGHMRLVVEGAPADTGGDDLLAELTEVLDGEDEPQGPGPPSVAAVVRRIKRLNRYDGLTLSIVDPSEDQGGDPLDAAFGSGEASDSSVRAYRDPELRISGRVSMPVRVTR